MNASSPGRFVQRRPPRQHEIRWNHPGWFIMRALRRSLAAAVADAALKEGSTVLDYGCASRPYRDLMGPARYVGADLPGNPQADIHIRPDGTLPVDDASIDMVLSTQVLEHLPDPAAYLRECRRVLKPGGQLLLTTHGLWIYHKDPVDYWRWTGEGLCYEATRQGFAVERLEGLMGLAGVAVQLFQDATYYRLWRPLRMPYAIVLQRLIALFDRLHNPQSRRLNAMVYLLVARRPD